MSVREPPRPRSRRAVVRALEWAVTGFLVWARTLPRVLLPALLAWVPVTWFLFDAWKTQAAWVNDETRAYWLWRLLQVVRDTMVFAVAAVVILQWRGARLEWRGQPTRIFATFLALLSIQVVIRAGIEATYYFSLLWIDPESPYVTVATIAILLIFYCIVVPVTGLAIAGAVAIAEAHRDPLTVVLRSARLVRGNLAVLMFASFVQAMIDYAITRAMQTAERMVADEEIQFFVGEFISLPSITFAVACSLTYYHQLVATKSTVDPERVAAAFD